MITDIFISTLYYFTFTIEYNNEVIEDEKVSVEKINTLEIKKWEINDPEERCPICLETMKKIIIVLN